MQLDEPLSAVPATAPITPGIWVAGRRMLTAGLVLIVVAAAFEALAVAATMPATAADLGGLSWYGWAFSAFMLANMVAVTLAGPEADRRGPAPPFVAGSALFIGGLLVAGIAPNMPILIGGRAIQGLGAGVISAVVYIVVGRGYAEAARPRMLAIISSAWVIPGLIGPALAGAIADLAGWRWVFLGLAPLPVIAAVMALPALRRLQPIPHDEGDDSRARQAEIRSAMMLAGGAGLLLGGLGFLAETPVLGLALLVGGAMLAVVALRRVLPAGTLRAAAGLPAAIAAMGLLNMAFFGVDAFVPLVLTEVRGLTVLTAGLTLTAATLTWTAASWVQAQLATRVRPGPIAISGLLLMLVGIAATAGAALPTVPALANLATWAIAGFGIGLAYSALSLAMLEKAEKGHEGRAAAALQIASQLGTALGAGVGGVIISSGNTTVTVERVLTQFLLMAGIAALGALAATRIGR